MYNTNLYIHYCYYVLYIIQYNIIIPGTYYIHTYKLYTLMYTAIHVYTLHTNLGSTNKCKVYPGIHLRHHKLQAGIPLFKWLLAWGRVGSVGAQDTVLNIIEREDVTGNVVTSVPPESLNLQHWAGQSWWGNKTMDGHGVVSVLFNSLKTAKHWIIYYLFVCAAQSIVITKDIPIIRQRAQLTPDKIYIFDQQRWQLVFPMKTHNNNLMVEMFNPSLSENLNL